MELCLYHVSTHTRPWAPCRPKIHPIGMAWQRAWSWYSLIFLLTPNHNCFGGCRGTGNRKLERGANSLVWKSAKGCFSDTNQEAHWYKRLWAAPTWSFVQRHQAQNCPLLTVRDKGTSWKQTLICLFAEAFLYPTDLLLEFSEHFVKLCLNRRFWFTKLFFFSFFSSIVFLPKEIHSSG